MSVDIHCQEDSVFGTTEVVGTDYVPAADLDIAAGIVSAPAADQGRTVT
jgi:hypothetical protein